MLRSLVGSEMCIRDRYQLPCEARVLDEISCQVNNLVPGYNEESSVIPHAAGNAGVLDDMLQRRAAQRNSVLQADSVLALEQLVYWTSPCSNSINSGSCFESGMDMNRSRMLLLPFSQFQFDLYRFNNSIYSLCYFRLLIVGNSSVRTAFKRISTSGHKTLASMLDRSICP